MAIESHIHKFIRSLFFSSTSDIRTAPKLSLISLKFVDEHAHLEKPYFEFFQNTFRKQAQISYIIALFFYSSFSFLDIAVAPEFSNQFICIRLCIVAPTILFALFLTTRDYFNNYIQIILALSILIVGAGIIAMIVIGGPKINSSYYAGLILVFIFSYTFVGLQYKLAMATTWSLVLMYEIASLSMNLSVEMFISNNFFFISTLLFSMIAGYSIELYRRGEFFIYHLLELEKNKIEIDNLELEKRVAQRTLELVKAKEEAEKADRMKSIFLAQMSHEIRTPINALVSMSSLIRYDFENIATEDQLTSFDIIDRAGGRIIRSVDLILNLSEIQAGTYQPSPEKFNIYSDILSLIVVENKKLVQKNGVELELIAKTKETEMVADSYTVNQIFRQLIENAIKYTDKGSIKIILDRDENNNLFVEVSDTGIGIEETYLHDLFEPFTQEEMGYTRKYEGNGIGLALVKKYCELNNAEIEVISQKDVGTTFKIIFR